MIYRIERASLALILVGVAVLFWGGIEFATAALLRSSGGMTVVQMGKEWLATLDASQKEKALLSYALPQRTDWHFIPKPQRKGLSLREMTVPQKAAARRLLQAAVSQIGFEKSAQIMELDEILRVQEGTKAKNIRDHEHYFFTLFGEPSDQTTWSLSVEGHHLSLNFVVHDGRIVDSTPQFMGANPAIVGTHLPGLPAKGFRLLASEELLAFELLGMLSAEQKKKAIISPQAFAEIRGAGQSQPPDEPLVGIPFRELDRAAQRVLGRLVKNYCGSMIESVAAERLRLIDASTGIAGSPETVGWNNIHFAWAGAEKPGIGHSYRIEGSTFVIEFCNVQNDAEGNPANHIHCIWRDRTGDFDLPK